MAKTVRLKCDVGNVSCSSMVDQLTGSSPIFVCSDDATVDVGFFKNGRISEDVKEFKRAELYLKETDGANVNYFIKSVSEINADLTVADWAAGKKHLSFSLDSVDTNVAKGKKWLAVVLYYGDYGKSTYIAGDVYFVPSGTENQDVSEPEISNLKNEILSITKSVAENVNAINSAVQSVNEKVLDAQTYKDYAVQAASDALNYKNQAAQSAQSASDADASAVQSAKSALISSQSANASAESAATSEANAQISLNSCEDIERSLELLSENVEGTKVDIENQLNAARSLAIEAGNSASKALDSATGAENASIAAQSALSQIGEIKIDIDEALKNIETAKTEAVDAVETAGANAVSEVNAATEEAKTVIDGWSDQTSRFAKAESAISLLQADKLNRGALWFNKAKIATATNNATTLPLTLCATYECADLSSGYFDFLATHKVSGWTTSIPVGRTGSTSGFGFGVINNENYVNRIFGVKLSTPDAADVHVARHGYDCGVWLKSDSFEKFEGRHTFIATISEEITNGIPKIVLYLDGSILSPNRNFKYNGGLQSAELGAGQSKVLIGSTEYFSTAISTIPVKLSRLKIFNCVLPATKADDVNGIGYTVEDYHNGVDEPPIMQDVSATYRALLSLQDYTILNGSTQQVFDVSGNANDATATLSDGGSLKGSNDISVGRLIDFIKGQSA